jgi:hypothetical protein
MAATTGQLGLVTPTQGTLSGTWGDTVNNGITEYTNIAIAATLTLTGDGAVTLANTTGSASATNITSTLTGAGTVTAQFAIVKVTGTLTTTKVVTFGSAGSAPYSKTYTVVNAATGGSVSFTAYGGTGVTIAVGESAYVYYDGTNIVKVSSTVASGVTTFQTSMSGLTPSTATSGAVTLAGTLGTANGGTNLTSFTSGGAVYATSTSALTTGTLPTTAGGTALTSFTSGGAVYATSTSALTTGTLPVASGGTNLTSGTSGGVLAYTASGVLASSGALAANNVVVGGGAGAAPSSTNLLAISAAVTSGNYIQGIGYADTVVALGSSGATKNIDIVNGGVFTCTLSQSCTFTLRYPVATGASSFTLILTNGGAGYTVAWAGGTFKFPGGSVTRTTTSGAIDIWFFFTPDGGTTYYGSIPMANLS